MARYYYREEVRHTGLNKYQVVTGATKWELSQKVAAKKAQWDEQWRRKLERDAKAAERAKKARTAEEGLRSAERETSEAEQLWESLKTILADSLEVNELSFENLKRTDEFTTKKPQLKEFEALPDEPQRNDAIYNPAPTLFMKLSKKCMQEFDEANQATFERAHDAWAAEVERVKSRNQKKAQKNAQKLEAWELEKSEFYRVRDEHNKNVDAMREGVVAGKKEDVETFYSLALDTVSFPLDFDAAMEVEYDPEAKQLAVDMFFPTMGDMPRLKKVTYVKSRGEYKRSLYSDAEVKRAYEGVMYQIVLRLAKCVFTSGDCCSSVEAFALNGRLDTTDAATGQRITPCVLTLRVTREDYEAVNLASVDPKAWFKSSKGISAASLATVTPVTPVIQLDRDDARFVEGYAVEETIDAGTNLAAMDWQDFENLVRELFAEEFCVPGGEVKVTRASRDGGVDAVAFDPDPIRGGKIVIQAKRYTNTVGVEAVRALYGTMLNEGAMKGILVTTSNYGNDAYDFANGKPLTLLNGANLLALLAKHGHRARIDLDEAKDMLALKRS